MIAKLPEYDSQRSDFGLNSLERLGAFFTSQIHDLNNQIAVLSNSELLRPNDASASPCMNQFLEGLFTAVHRLSATCEQFNDVRKKYPVEVEKISLSEANDAIIGAVGDCKGWRAEGLLSGGQRVCLNAGWLSAIVTQLIIHMQAANGVVRLSIGELPPRQYQYNLRSGFNEGPTRALLVHFLGEKLPNSLVTEPASQELTIALELIRLLGAAISLHRSDSAQDYLLAFRLMG